MVENYWEAAGVIAAMRAGIVPESVRRPLTATVVERRIQGGVDKLVSYDRSVPR